jgi:HEAT repeat protein
LLNTIFNIRQCEPSLLADMNAETVRRQRAVDVLASMLWDNDPLLRFAGVWTLHQIGDTRAVAPLSAKLKDTDECVRAAAERALAHFGVTETSGPDGTRFVENTDGWGMGPMV